MSSSDGEILRPTVHVVLRRFLRLKTVHFQDGKKKPHRNNNRFKKHFQSTASSLDSDRKSFFSELSGGTDSESSK